MVSQVDTCLNSSVTCRDDGRVWYAIYTYPKYEARVTKELTLQNIISFLPSFLTRSRWKDRMVQLATPLFPGYVFIRIEAAERSRVLMTHGVVRILSYSGRPAVIPDAEIEAVRLCLSAGVARSVVSSIAVGERVRVRSGLLEGLEGFVSRAKNSRMLLVPVSLLHQSISIEVDANLLEVLPTKRPVSISLN